MLDAINTFCLVLMDLLFGWLLSWPRDLVLFFVALGTSLVLIVVRRYATNQDMLGRCKADKRRLKHLIREAKCQNDKQAIKRYRQTMGQIGRTVLMAEPKPLLIAIVPIALLAVWAFARVAYLPLTAEDSITIKAHFPVSSIGDRVHLLPATGMAAETGWIQQIALDDSVEDAASGVATWRLQCNERSEPYELMVRYRGQVVNSSLIVDGRRYAQPLIFHDSSDVIATEVVLTVYKPFGVLPGISSIMLQPWIVGYLIYVIPLSLLLKYLLRVY